MSSLRIVIAGSTHHTRLIAESLTTAHFTVVGCITPQPKPIGRKQTITSNPLHEWAQQHTIPVVLIDIKIGRGLEPTMHQQFNQPDVTQPFCDILLVVDFGYYVPSWLLQKARIAPLNIHPSKLPRWRGSSPGQFALLYGDNPSAITLITVAKQMDQGDIWYQKEFTVKPDWDAAAYYQYAFEQMAAELPEVISTIATGNGAPVVQPVASPTPVARKISKPDSFIPWSVVRYAVSGDVTLLEIATNELQSYLQNADQHEPPLLAALLLEAKPDEWLTWLERAVRAFHPWPNVWTLAPTVRGQLRLQIHQAHPNQAKLVLDQVQLEGQQPATFNQIKTSIVLK